MCCGLTSPRTRKPELSAAEGQRWRTHSHSGCLPCLGTRDINLQRPLQLAPGWELQSSMQLAMTSPDQVSQVLSTLRESEAGIWEGPASGPLLTSHPDFHRFASLALLTSINLGVGVSI